MTQPQTSLRVPQSLNTVTSLQVRKCGSVPAWSVVSGSRARKKKPWAMVGRAFLELPYLILQIGPARTHKKALCPAGIRLIDSALFNYCNLKNTILFRKLL